MHLLPITIVLFVFQNIPPGEFVEQTLIKRLEKIISEQNIVIDDLKSKLNKAQDELFAMKKKFAELMRTSESPVGSGNESMFV